MIFHMNIYYDNIIYYLQQSGGVSRYWHELSRRLIKDENISAKFIERRQAPIGKVRYSLDIPASDIIYEVSMPLSAARYLPIAADIKDGGIFHSSYYRVHPSLKLKKVVTVHDFTYEYFFKGLKKFIHSAQKEYAVKNADKIICVSANTKKDLLKFYPYIPEDRISVVHNGVGDDFAPSLKPREEILESLGLKEDKFVIFIGERGGYKNFATAVRACSAEGGFLLVLGGRDLGADEISLLNQHLKDRYKHFGYVDNDRLRDFYSIAFCLLYPSLYEGFGIPVLEAMRCGCPVIASNTSSLPEAAGDAGILTEGTSAEDFAKRMASLTIGERRQSIIDKGLRHSANFSWDRCYAETMNIYKNILQ